MSATTSKTHQYNIHEAKTHLSRILEEVEAGDEVILSRAGTPIAKVVSLHPKPQRTFGLLKGQVEVADDFDEYDEEIAAMFGLDP